MSKLKVQMKKFKLAKSGGSVSGKIWHLDFDIHEPKMVLRPL
jgi:hypothetical protein